jgi:hypothetical protein
VFGSQVLEVMIGLLLIYLALSVACSGIKEVIASLFALRSKTLKAGIRNMLQDANGDLAAKILGHPLISATAPPGKLPSYISSRAFALALLDAVTPVEGTTQPPTIQDVRAAVASLPGTKLRKTLLGFIDSAHGDLGQAQINIEHWFDDTMERVSGWYKRTAQKLIFGAGLLLCLALNADTFQIAKELWSDQSLRNAVVAQATERIREGGAVRPVSGGSAEAATADVRSISEELQPLPLGWGRAATGVRGTIDIWPSVLLKLLGILVTSFAILMGAPFWFDLLNRVINLRTSGSPPAPSQSVSRN